MLKINNVIELHQNNLTMYVLKLSVNDLLNNYVIDSYDSKLKNSTGYQRPPFPAHYKKIAQYLVSNTESAILPMAIIGAIDENDIKKIDNSIILENNIRIVDGQHRIKGIEYLKQSNIPEYVQKYGQIEREYEFPVILLAIDSDNELVEMETFININSKGKKVSTNLAQELRNKRFHKVINDDPVEVNKELYDIISSGVAKKLSNSPYSFWYNKLTMGDEISNEKPISFSAFTKSIIPIVNSYFKYKINKNQISVTDIEIIENKIVEFIEHVWSIVSVKWKQCFVKNDLQFYKKEFNICKGIGVYSIHGLVKECLDEIYDFKPQKNIDLNDILFRFEEIITKSEVESDWWRVGGPFTGLSSGQGFKKIISYIKNEEEYF